MTSFDLDLFPLLDKEPLSIGELVARRRLNPVLAQSFMRVLQTSGFVTLQSGKYNLTDLARSVLPIYANIKSWIEEMKQFFHRVDDLTQSLFDLDYQKKIYSQNFYSSRVLSM